MKQNKKHLSTLCGLAIILSTFFTCLLTFEIALAQDDDFTQIGILNIMTSVIISNNADRPRNNKSLLTLYNDTGATIKSMYKTIGSEREWVIHVLPPRTSLSFYIYPRRAVLIFEAICIYGQVLAGTDYHFDDSEARYLRLTPSLFDKSVMFDEAGCGSLTFTGNWNTTWGLMYLDQDEAGHVTGNYPHDNGRIEGDISEDSIVTLVGTWTENRVVSDPADTGPVKFIMSENGLSFTGEWSYAGSEDVSYYWSGSRCGFEGENPLHLPLCIEPE